jgi:hypothetical protein
MDRNGPERDDRSTWVLTFGAEIQCSLVSEPERARVVLLLGIRGPTLLAAVIVPA